MLKNKIDGVPIFLKKVIEKEINKKDQEKVCIITRFPPEPNGYLHLGHIKSVFLNCKIANKYNGKFNVRFDDTNPLKEQRKYVNSILKDINWLKLDLKFNIFYTSDYFDDLYRYALKLINNGKAYVDDLNFEQIRLYRGTLLVAGKNSPYRERSIDINLDLFNKMKNGFFDNGEKVLRAKIRMDHTNILMRDPVLYRIRKVEHYRTGYKWCIYPMYDFAHCISDMLENVTHSLCTLEFENNKILYDWILTKIGAINYPKQIEYARLNVTYNILSKSSIKKMIDGNYVSDWDDPRLLTISGLRRRGYNTKSLKEFCTSVGVGKKGSVVDIGLLENSVRKNLNLTSRRAMAVINPLKVIIINYPNNKFEYIEAVNNPENPKYGLRIIPFSREIYIENDDFLEKPTKKFFRLSIGNEVRLRYAFFIRCVRVIKDIDGNIVEIHCTYDPKSRGGNSPDGRKVKSTLHWVSAHHAIDAKIRLYSRLFVEENLQVYEGVDDLYSFFNNNSLRVLNNCKLEPGLINATIGNVYQFERLGYFCLDNKGSGSDCLIFNRTVELRNKWLKMKNLNF